MNRFDWVGLILFYPSVIAVFTGVMRFIDLMSYANI